MTKYQSIVDTSDRDSSISSYRAISEFGSALDDQRPLLTNDTEDLSICHTVYAYEDEPSATIASCSINLANTILGTGMLAMPSALASVGLIPGIILILYAGCTSGLGLYFLSQCADKVGNRQASFTSLSKLTWPKLGIFFDLAIAIKCFGVAISYLIIIGDLMPQIFSVYNELKDNSERSVTRVILNSIGSAAFIYELVAVLGYLSFGKNVKGNIILEYPQSYFVAFGRLAIVILVIFSYPLQAHPCRASLEKTLAHHTSHKRSHFILTTTILVFSFLVAISISQLDIVLSFVGSTGSTSISFILPGLFYFKIFRDDAWYHWKRLVSLFLIIYGLLVMTICLTFNIKRLL
ncbi:hypothetical protein G6F18_001656 [Rhizopus arrhizus]|nr:hypothetical protein G6F18_001656 [Rhizopus arrhizus]KAG1011960.1 hypothetical protein G6F27_003267 [Rhizopus arrhizus]